MELTIALILAGIYFKLGEIACNQGVGNNTDKKMKIEYLELSKRYLTTSLWLFHSSIIPFGYTVGKYFGLY